MNMRPFQKGSIGVVLLASLALTSCDEYLSRVPLSEEPTAPIPDSLLGDWLFVDTSEIRIRPMAQLSVYPWDKDEFLGLYTSYSDKHPGMTGVTPMRLFRTDIGETPYVNLMYLEDVDRDFAFYTYQSPDSLVVRYSFVTNAFKDTFATSAQFYAYVSRNPATFTAALDTTWLSFYRDRYWTWEKANAKWLHNITQAWTCEPTGDPDSIFVWPAEKMLADWRCKPLSIFDLHSACKPFHLYPYKEEIRTIPDDWGPDPVGYYILSLRDGSAIKYLHFPGSLTDLTNGIKYVKSPQ